MVELFTNTNVLKELNLGCLEKKLMFGNIRAF